MRISTGLLVLALGACDAFAAGPSDVVVEVFNSFSPREQRLIYAVTADPAVEGRFGAGLAEIAGKQGKPDEYEAAKLKFQLDWLGKINEFSGKYRSGDPALQARMGQIPKANLNELIEKEEAKARSGDSSNLAWFVEYDRSKWEGKLLPAVWDKVEDAPMLEYSIAGMRSMTSTQKKELIDKLDAAKSWYYSAAGTAEEIVKQTKAEFIADLGKAQGDYARRAQTAREQLAKISTRLETVLAKKPGAAQPEDLAGAGAGFDGGKTLKDREESPVGAGSGEKEAPPVAGSEKTPGDRKDAGALKPSLPGGESSGAKTSPSGEPPSPVPPSSGGFSLRGGNGPNLKADENFGKSAPEKEGIGAKIAQAFKSPKIGAVAGGLLGGLLGFLFGGPIGAVIGLAAGAAVMGAASRALNG